ncbi:MAG TPA: GNAT family N-acetyltransferase [Gemmatimonadaceae bacterium]|nr:GNAT family N-acetyltransferase [Gemmatimonadaceae bacterium]
MPLEIVDQGKGLTLREPLTDAEWEDYHTLRRTILFERRGQFGVYNASHGDERAPGNHPFLFLLEGEAAGTIRVDIGDSEAIFRLVAIREDLQRRGHGQQMLALAERLVRDRKKALIHSHVVRTAVGFYERCGFSREGPDRVGETVLMVKALGPFRASDS